MRRYALLLGLLLSAAAHAAPPLLDLVGAGHAGVADAGGITWHSTYLPAVPEDRDGRIRLAAPVPAHVTWEVGDAPIVPVRDGEGRVVALDVGARRGTLEVTTHEPPPSADDVVLHPPLVAGEVVQRVALQGARFDPAPSLGAEHRLRLFQEPEIRNRDRRRLDWKLGLHGRTGALYVLGDPRITLAGGVPGTLRPAGAVTPAVTASVAGGFVVVLALMALAIRLLDRRARWEKVEAYLRNELTPEPEEDEPAPTS